MLLRCTNLVWPGGEELDIFLFQSRKDENFRSILMQHIKVLTDPAYRLRRTLSNQNQSSLLVTHKWSAGHDDVDSSVNISPQNGEALPSKRPSLLSQETVLL